MYMIFGLRLGPNFGMRQVADKNFYLRLIGYKMRVCAVFTETPNLRLWLTVEIQKLKYKVKSMECKCKSLIDDCSEYPIKSTQKRIENTNIWL